MSDDLTVTEINRQSPTTCRTHAARLGIVTGEMDDKGTIYVYFPSVLWGYYRHEDEIVTWPELRPEIAADVVTVAHALRAEFDTARLSDRIRRLRDELLAAQATLETAEVTS